MKKSCLEEEWTENKKCHQAEEVLWPKHTHEDTKSNTPSKEHPKEDEKVKEKIDLGT